MRINAAGLDIIKRFEGCKLEAYKCPAGVWTIGYGHTGDVKPGRKITAHEADAILDVDVDTFERGVAKLFAHVPLNENQFSALVSFAFNVGLDALAKSTLRTLCVPGSMGHAANQFLRWNKAGGVVLAGLVKRRAAERELFLKP